MEEKKESLSEQIREKPSEQIVEDYLIDSHLHMQYFTNEELVSIVKNSINNEIPLLRFLTNSTSNKDFEQTVSLSRKLNLEFKINNLVIPGIGYHPWYLEDLGSNWLDEMKVFLDLLSSTNTTFFIGEIGIDGGKVKKKVSLQSQLEIFKAQMEIANSMKKVVTIHCVYEWEKLTKALLSYNLSNLEDKIILHSFQGKVKDLNKLLGKKIWISISSGCYCEKNFEMLKSIPLDSLLLESDSPSMFNKEIYTEETEYKNYPIDEKGNYKNLPLSILPLAKKLSELRKVPFQDLLSQVKKNSMKLLKHIL